MLTFKILLLLFLANGSPVVAKRILGTRLALPLDCGNKFVDGRPLFGASKTIRGIVSSILATSAGAMLTGIPMIVGMQFALASMCGDLASSFIKRRLGLPPSSRALGLDQLPESILPMLVCWHALNLDLATALAAVAIFFAGELLLSRILFRLKIRERPY
ncbi:MAG: CDP-archaeol synthase [Gammaproteobacteria bacterium]|nr:CDP-archaeol synthase [Gammaproteobacteria bacterium]MDH3448696.1 CDP-archaeol synthase [Gammaproteobacteria bacterium]